MKADISRRGVLKLGLALLILAGLVIAFGFADYAWLRGTEFFLHAMLIVAISFFILAVALVLSGIVGWMKDRSSHV